MNSYKCEIGFNATGSIWVDAIDSESAEDNIFSMTLQDMRDSSLQKFFPKNITLLRIISIELQEI